MATSTNSPPECMVRTENGSFPIARKPRQPDTCRMVVVIRSVPYSVRPIRAESPEVIKAWTLRKADGEAYTVADTIDGQSCTCADFVYRHEGNDAIGCKHTRSLRALGLIDPDGEGPADWPGWTDHTA